MHQSPHSSNRAKLILRCYGVVQRAVGELAFIAPRIAGVGTRILIIVGRRDLRRAFASPNVGSVSDTKPLPSNFDRAPL